MKASEKLRKQIKMLENQQAKLDEQCEKIMLQVGKLEDRLMDLDVKLEEAEEREALAEQDVDLVATGERPSPAQAKLMKEQPYSYGVHFRRAKALKKVASPGAVCVSTRYFSSKKEAMHHGKRFAKIHGHKEFSVVVVNKKANAWVNWKTGKTNPVI